jgi:hypothetical protein
MIAVCVDPEMVNEAWPNFRELIRKAIDKVGISDFKNIEKEVLEKRSLLWLAYDGERVHAAAVTMLIDNVCEIVACGGNNLSQFLPLIENIEQFARYENCRSMRIIGRKGWLRVLKKYKQKAIIIERKL